MQISVNADDFGISKEVSQTIIDFVHKGYCDTTTVMVNMNDFKGSRDMAVNAGIGERTGLHLCLTEGVPITKGIAENPIFAQNGVFGCYKTHRNCRFFLNDKVKTVVCDELRAQIERYLELGYTGMTMDSHQGVHMDWSIYPIVMKLFEEYGFKRLRRSPNLKNDFKRKLLRIPFDRAVNTHGIPHFDCLGNFRDFKDHLIKLENSDQTVEIMCHPKEINGTVYIDWCNRLTLQDYKDELSVCSRNRFER